MSRRRGGGHQQTKTISNDEPVGQRGTVVSASDS